MFLYFIQRKRWLDEDTEFLRSLWESYGATDEPADSFVERWPQRPYSLRHSTTSFTAATATFPTKSAQHWR